MTRSGHPCPARHCTRTAPAELLACRGHNAELPKALRRRANRAWRSQNRTSAEATALRQALAIIGNRLLESSPSATTERWIRHATR